MTVSRSLVAGVLAAFVLILVAVSGQAHGPSMHKLDGAWTAVAAERDGKPADELRGHVLTFSRDQFVIRDAAGKILYRGIFRVDTTRKPAHIDFHHAEGELRGKTWLGVYALEGDTLRIPTTPSIPPGPVRCAWPRPPTPATSC